MINDRIREAARALDPEAWGPLPGPEALMRKSKAMAWAYRQAFPTVILDEPMRPEYRRRAGAKRP